MTIKEYMMFSKFHNKRLSSSYAPLARGAGKDISEVYKPSQGGIFSKTQAKRTPESVSQESLTLVLDQVPHPPLFSRRCLIIPLRILLGPFNQYLQPRAPLYWHQLLVMLDPLTLSWSSTIRSVFPPRTVFWV